jgi:hypothetical protein
MSDLSEALEEEANRLCTKRLMVQEIGRALALEPRHRKRTRRGNTLSHRTLFHYFTPSVVDLNNAPAARAIWIDAHHKAWCRRLQERSPTEEELAQIYGEMIRAMGDDPKYGLPKRHAGPKQRSSPLRSSSS